MRKLIKYSVEGRKLKSNLRSQCKSPLALPSAAQLVGCHPANEKVKGLIPCLGTCLVVGLGPDHGM